MTLKTNFNNTLYVLLIYVTPKLNRHSKAIYVNLYIYSRNPYLMQYVKVISLSSHQGDE